MTPREELVPTETPRKKRQNLMIYLVILFGVAFLLLLLSYFMEKRNSDEVISGLEQSLSSLQSLSRLVDENSALKEQVAALEETLGEKEAELEALKSEYLAALTALAVIGEQEQTVRALDALQQIQRLFHRQAHGAARALILAFEEEGLRDYLPQEKRFLSDHPLALSPLEQYEALYDALF